MKNIKDPKYQEDKVSQSNVLVRLKQAIVYDGLLTEQNLLDAETISKRKQEPLSKTFDTLGYVKTERLSKFIENQIHIPMVNIDDYEIDLKSLSIIPQKIASRYNILPLKFAENVLTVAISNPLDIISLDKLDPVAEYKVETVIASRESINVAINRRYDIKIEREELIEEIAGNFQKTRHKEKEEERTNQYANEINEIRLRREAEEPPIVRLVNSYIAQAIVEGASDIHLEPKKDAMQVRFRIDGHLFNRHEVSSKLIAPILSRIKMMAGLDITIKRFPQNGHIGLKVKDKNIDIQTSTFPSINGENVVLKILDKTGRVLQLSEMGLSEENMNIFKKLMRATGGMILGSGPPGSGKTTTLYSLMNTIDTSDKNIVTIEDPIEHEIEGIVQSQINDTTGMTYSNSLNAIMRQDPDIIYVGEIRDRETATTAIHAALAGHLVLSTIHTNNAVEVISRLDDMGIGEGLIESALNGVFTQRLVRKLCVKCRQTYTPDESLLKILELPKDTHFFKKVGCEDCSGIGYKGRVGLFEIIVFDRKIKTLISKNASEQDMIKTAQTHGMKTLFEDGLQKIRQGVTTFDEVKKATEKI